MVACETEPKQPQPEYSPVELNDLVVAVRSAVILDSLVDTDWNIECDDVIKLWLSVTDHELLSFFFVDGKLTASVSMPAMHVRDIFYFLRNPNHIFTLDNFLDDVTFGRIDNHVDGHMLTVVEQIYAPIFFHTSDWTATCKAQFCKSLYLFLAKLTALHHKLSGRTVLYIPSEVYAMPIKEAAADVRLVNRLELIAEHWIGQLRMAISDREQVAPYALLCPNDEFEFWEYRRECIPFHRSNFFFTDLRFYFQLANCPD